MKKFIYSASILLSVFLFGGCHEDETANISKVTYFPEFEMSGDDEMFLSIGATYTEPGVIATEQGEEIPVTATVKGRYTGYSGSTVPTNVADDYTITYSAVNVDGFAGSISRSVYVYKAGDLVNSIEGLYVANVKRTPSQGAVAATANLKYILIWKVSDNKYQISDNIGGYYAIGRGYGDAYIAGGMTVTSTDIPNNVFTYGAPVGVGAFGGACSTSAMIVDAAAKTVTFTSDWDSGYKFVVTLKPVVL